MISYSKIAAFLVIVILSSSCNRQIIPANDTESRFYPDPPGRPRIQYLTSISNSEDITGERSRFQTFVMGAADIIPISKPYGIASTENKIYICDPAESILEIIDLSKNTFRVFKPGGQGSLIQPLNCTIDKEGRIYIADVSKRQVIIFDNTEKYIGTIYGPEEFRPTDVAVADKLIYIADPDNNKILVYDKSSLDLVRSIPENAEEGDEDWLYNPMNITITEGFIYITDFGHSRIKKFTLTGNYINSVGSYGRNLGQFTRPKGIAVDNENNIFVVDAAFSNVQIFNEKGQLLLYFGGSSSGNPGDMYMPSNVIVDYLNLEHFRDMVDPGYDLKYLILVTNQFGSDKVNVYGRIDPKQ